MSQVKTIMLLLIVQEMHEQRPWQLRSRMQSKNAKAKNRAKILKSNLPRKSAKVTLTNSWLWKKDRITRSEKCCTDLRITLRLPYPLNVLDYQVITLLYRRVLSRPQKMKPLDPKNATKTKIKFQQPLQLPKKRTEVRFLSVERKLQSQHFNFVRAKNLRQKRRGIGKHRLRKTERGKREMGNLSVRMREMNAALILIVAMLLMQEHPHFKVFKGRGGGELRTSPEKSCTPSPWEWKWS